MSKEKEQKKANTHRPKRPLFSPTPIQKTPAESQFVPMGITYKETAGGGGMRGLRQTAVLDMQRTLGNAPTSETLHNTQTAAGDYSSNDYNVGSWSDRGASGNIQYDMTRSGSGVTVNLRIKFVATLGTATTEATALPPGQPRTFATNMCQRLVQFYNNRFVLVGRKRTTRDGGVPGGVPDAGVAPSQPEVRLPLNFRATPVFDVDANSHSNVHLNTSTTATGGAGAAINAQEWLFPPACNLYRWLLLW